MSLLDVSPYISWKGTATNSLAPSNSRPDLNAAGPAFKAQPINHWRKQLLPNAGSGNNNRRAGIGMPMDTPSGSVYLGNTASNTDCLPSYVTTGVASLKENIIGNNSCVSNADNCFNKPIRIRPATTLLSKKYYTNMKSYMRSRSLLFDQKLTALPNPDITYLDANGDLLYPNDTDTTRQTQNCLVCTDTVAAGQTTYKPNNKQYAQQGAVDSSSRLTRLKLNTINKNAASYSETFGTTAPRYRGMASTPYFLKSKYQVCVPMSLSGQKNLCAV